MKYIGKILCVYIDIHMVGSTHTQNPTTHSYNISLNEIVDVIKGQEGIKLLIRTY